MASSGTTTFDLAIDEIVEQGDLVPLQRIGDHGIALAAEKIENRSGLVRRKSWMVSHTRKITPFFASATNNSNSRHVPLSPNAARSAKITIRPPATAPPAPRR